MILTVARESRRAPAPRKNLLHAVDVARFNAQYGNSLTVKESTRFHGRFLIIDRSTLIYVGASLNHLGKRCFAFSSNISRSWLKALGAKGFPRTPPESP